MECLRLVVIMETLRYTCVQISLLWFTSLRSEEVVKRKSAQGHFLFMVVMETLKYTFIPSFKGGVGTTVTQSLPSRDV